MMGPREQPVDWHRIEREQRPALSVVDSRARLRACLIAFLILLGVVFARVVQLEATQGAAFRRVAAAPRIERRLVPVARGQILSRDGTVLARNRQVRCVALRYCYLEDPPDAAWLRAQARANLPRDARRDPARLAAEEARLRGERRAMHERLAALVGVPADEWNRRAAEVQSRVERIARTVNDRQQSRFEQHRRDGLEAQTWLDRWLGPDEQRPPERLVVREQRDPRGELDYHVMAEDVSARVVEEIEKHPDRWPGAKIVGRTRREYPFGMRAAHVLGYLASVESPESRVQSQGPSTLDSGLSTFGRAGVERQYDRRLGGRPGLKEQRTDRGGRLASSRWIEAPRPGEVLALTLDARLQATAETLLDEALARRTLSGARPATAGAAAVVMDVRTGAILACASAPRFDPNVFDGGDNREVRRLLGDPARPLFDRTIQMAVAPGSLSKIVTAAALVESRAVDPRESFYCRGYLEKPTALRCQIYDQFERGHGEVTLPDALAESCNVYFFHHAGRLGPGPLTAWLDRFGFGRATGVDLPGEAAGCVPTPESIAALEGHDWKVDDTRRVAVGQGSLTVTPMQAVRMTAAVANGGRLVSPHVVQKSSDDDAPPDASPVPGLDAATLDAIRHGLEMAVASPKGTAHATVFNESIAVAGKTGTAQTGGDRSPHAWFAGYAPVDDPRVALVVVVEHAGDGGEVAGPVAARLLLRLAQLGLLDTKEMEPQINTDEHR